MSSSFSFSIFLIRRLTDKMYVPFNGALMRFHKHSPYLCEALNVMATSPPPGKTSTDWGSLLYFKLFRRLVASSVPPFKILPFCFSDGRSCRLDNRLLDPFKPDNKKGLWTFGLGLEEGGGLDRLLGKCLASTSIINGRRVFQEAEEVRWEIEWA